MKLIQANFYMIILIFILLGLGIVGILGNTIYSGADEAAHFDYINKLISNKSLPTLDMMIDSKNLAFEQANPKTIPHHLQHEAVQPPLYYLVSSFIGSFFSSFYVRLLVLRGLGVLLLIGTVYFCFKIYNTLIKEKILNRNDFLFFSIVILFVTSSFFQKIMIPLNNEHLAVFLVTILFYFLTKYHNSDWNYNKLIIISVLSLAIIYTKLTACYIITVVFFFLYYKKRIQDLILYFSILVAGLFPWFLFNYKNYHALTGIKQHFAIVAPMVNPTNQTFTILDIFKKVPDIFTSTWFGGKVFKSEIIISDFLSVLVMLSLTTTIFFVLKKSIALLFYIAIYMNFIVLSVATHTTPVFSILGRYMFTNLVPFIIIFYIFSLNFYQEYFTKVISWIYAASAFFFIGIHVFNLLIY